MEFLAARAAEGPDHRRVAEEFAPELRASPAEVEKRIGRAVALTGRMPRVLTAMRAGRIESYGAKRVLDVTAPLTDDQARAVDDLLAEKLGSAPASTWQPRNMVRHVARLMEKVDPGGQTERARRSRAHRRIELDHRPHACSTLSAKLPTELAAACYARVDAMAGSLRKRGEQRTLDQLRADITADLLLGNDPGVTPPEAAATVYIHMPADTALSISDSACELDGYGPIPAPIAREIMTNERSIWRKVLCDPGTGDPVDLGRTRRSPNEHVRTLVRVRDRECIFPWCRRPARHCDIDHERQWAEHHNDTSVDNSGPRCRRHQRLKNDPRWITRYDPVHGTASVTTPNGTTHTGRREPIIEPRPLSPGDTRPA